MIKNLDAKIFIHIPKSGGMTIRHSPQLKNKIMACTPELHESPEYTKGLLKKMKEIQDHHGFQHCPWKHIKPGYRNYYDAFAIIRNPWDRVVSRYFFAKKVIEVEKKEPVGKHRVDSFEHFLTERDLWYNEPYLHHRAIRGWQPAYEYVTDNKNAIRCDMLRFENYNEDVCEYFNLPKMSRARNVTALNAGSYKDVYTTKTIQMVADWYKIDIDTWGYDFDSGPTKNYWNMKK